MAKPKLISVFVNNYHLSAAGIQFLVCFTTLLMVLRFVLDAYRHRSSNKTMRMGMVLLDTATHALLHFSLGAMQRPSEQNNYYMVWAVLLVTLRYSVKLGRPAGVALKQTPLVDLMSSFWAANILRSSAPATLKIPVWLLWSINSLRIIHGFISSERATAYHRENVRLVTEYMRPPKIMTASSESNSNPATMAGYNYLVLSEAKQRKKVRPPYYRLELKTTNEEKLITIDKIWQWGEDQSAHGRRVSALLNEQGGKLKDLCLSFALYKLLRRRFYNLPIHESTLDKTKQLIFQGILCSANGNASTISMSTVDAETESSSLQSAAAAAAAPYDDPELTARGESAATVENTSTDQQRQLDHERAFRVTKAELSFLNDFFYSRHALLFATGFPFIRLLLSTLLVGVISYMALAIHRFSKVAKEDELGRVHHGVIFTWILLTLLGLKEIIEIAGYVFSDWTKVLLLCSYVQQPWWLRGPAIATLVRWLCSCSLVKRWHGRIGQYNLVFGVLRRHTFALTDLSEEVKKTIFLSLRSRLGDEQPDLKGESSDKSYLERTLSSQLAKINSEEKRGALNDAISKVNEFHGDVHRILLWHIATCYCECSLATTRNNISVHRPWLVKTVILPRFKYTGIWTGPFIEESKLETLGSTRQHYMTAVTLSQYCAHVVRLSNPLVPGNDIITTAVLTQVIKETRQALRGCYSVSETFDKLHEMATGDQENTMLKMGAELGQELLNATGDDELACWELLAELWAAFVLHLAESTRASKHKIYLSMGGELMTHLWALLSHAGLMGSVAHGEMGDGALPFRGEQQRQDVDMN